jgi:hypothetical protein
MKKRSTIFSGAIFVLLLLSVAGRAETFYAYLNGAQEVPAVATSATGYARVVVNPTTLAYSFTVVFNGLTSAQNNAHIHAPAAIGVSTGVAINFGVVGGTSGTITGSGTMNATQLQQIRQHLAYVNVHSANNSGGEIRGQLGIKRPVDFDGDGRQDFSILRFPSVAPQTITYFNLNSTGGVQIQPFGDASTDFPTPGDYDGDGKDDLAIYRSGVVAQSEMWIFRSSDSAVQKIFFGLNGDQAVNRDYDGDGITDLATFRDGVNPGDQAFWYIRRSTSGPLTNPGEFVIPFGTTGDGTTSFDTPVPGDYDGDGKFDLAVYRFGISPFNNYIVLRSSDNSVAYQPFGNFNSDYVVPGDYDGDGKYDFAIARTGAAGTSPMVWWILQSSTGTTRTQTFGITSDLPAQGDYDGDARADIAVYRPGAAATFWVFESFNNAARPTRWGTTGDFATNTFDIR